MTEPSINSEGDELSRLMILLLKRLSGSHAELIVDMHHVGIKTARIAELIGTTSNSANQAIQRDKRGKAKGKK